MSFKVVPLHTDYSHMLIICTECIAYCVRRNIRESSYSQLALESGSYWSFARGQDRVWRHECTRYCYGTFLIILISACSDIWSRWWRNVETQTRRAKDMTCSAVCSTLMKANQITTQSWQIANFGVSSLICIFHEQELSPKLSLGNIFIFLLAGESTTIKWKSYFLFNTITCRARGRCRIASEDTCAN